MGAASLRALWGRFGRATGGAMLIETAFIMPFLIMLAMGGTEFARYVLLHQKVQRAAVTVGDLMTRDSIVTTGDVTAALDAVAHVLSPFPSGDQSRIIISSVSRGATGTRVDWQQGGAGTLAAASRIGVAGGLATLPEGFALGQGDNVIIAEASYEYRMWISPVLGQDGRVLYHSAVFRPRRSSLSVLQ